MELAIIILSVLGKNRKTCDYFAELHEILGDRPDCNPVGLASSSSACSSHSSTPQPDDYDGVDLERSELDCTNDGITEVALLDDGTDDVTRHPAKKRKLMPKSRKEKSSKIHLVDQLQRMEEQRVKEEKEKLDFLKQNEAQKITIMKDLLGTLQQLVNKH